MVKISLTLIVFLWMSFQLHPQQVYFTDRNEAIAKLSPENPDPIIVYENYDYAISGLTVDQNAEWLYGMLDIEKLFRIHPDGSKIEILAEFESDPFGGAVITVALDNANDIAYILGSTTLVQYNLHSRQLKPLVYELDQYHLSPHQLALSDSFVYWSSRLDDLENGVIRRLKKGDVTPETIVSEKYCYFVEAIALAGEYLYWIAAPMNKNEFYKSVIYRAHSDGSNPHIFYNPNSEIDFPAGDLVYYRNNLYFDTQYAGIKKINFDGEVSPFVKIDYSIDYMLILP